MNAAALPIIEAAVRNGEAMGVLFGPFGGQDHYGSTLNPFERHGSNPVTRLDALGLSWGMDDDIDEAIGSLYSQGASAAADYYRFFENTAKLMIQATIEGLVIAMVPGGVYWVSIYHMSHAAADMQSDGLNWSNGLELGLSVLPLAGRIGTSFAETFNEMRAMRPSYARSPCNCFVAGTLVNTPDGLRPIETLRTGDEVMTRPENTPDASARPGRVSGVLHAMSAAVVWVTLSTGSTVGITPEHQVWTFQDGWTYANRLAIGDTFADQDGRAVRIVALTMDANATDVYNLEVAGTFTFFVHDIWVHNDSCWTHHIATNKNWVAEPQWSRHFAELFAKGNMTLEDAANQVVIASHAGPHSQTYHRMVYDTMKRAIEGLNTPEDIAKALRGALQQLAAKIREDPGIINR
jgi:hypothetical protein